MSSMSRTTPNLIRTSSIRLQIIRWQPLQVLDVARQMVGVWVSLPDLEISLVVEDDQREQQQKVTTNLFGAPGASLCTQS